MFILESILTDFLKNQEAIFISNKYNLTSISRATIRKTINVHVNLFELFPGKALSFGLVNLYYRIVNNSIYFTSEIMRDKFMAIFVQNMI